MRSTKDILNFKLWKRILPFLAESASNTSICELIRTGPVSYIFSLLSQNVSGAFLVSNTDYASHPHW